MKKLSVILLAGVGLVLAGCGNQGGSSDSYNTESGTNSKTNYNQRSLTNDYQGGAWSPGGSDAGVMSRTNQADWNTNGLRPQINPEQTNNVPQN